MPPPVAQGHDSSLGGVQHGLPQPGWPVAGNHLDRPAGRCAATGTPEAGRGAASRSALDRHPGRRGPDPATGVNPEIARRVVRRRRCGVGKVAGAGWAIERVSGLLRRFEGHSGFGLAP